MVLDAGYTLFLVRIARRLTVRADHPRFAALRADAVQDLCEVVTADRVLRRDSHCFETDDGLPETAPREKW